MQIAMISSYEEEKRENEVMSLSDRFHRKYKLQRTYWHSKSDYTSYALSDLDEVLLYLNFRTSGTLECGAHGNSFYDFYICKNNGSYYLKCFDTMHLDDVAAECAPKGAYGVKFDIGKRTDQYKKYLINNAMRAPIELDCNEVENLLNRLKDTPSDDLENCTANRYSKTSVELFDFVNSSTFSADDYVLPKYECYVDAIQYIIDKSGMVWLKDIGLQYVDSIEEALAKYIDKHLCSEYGVYDIEGLEDGDIISCGYYGGFDDIAIPFIGGLYKEGDENDVDFGDKVKIPSGISDYKKKSYVAIEALFRSVGFTNIRCVPLNDLRTGLLKKPDTVRSITINGKVITSGGKEFSPDAPIVIYYHSFVRW